MTRIGSSAVGWQGAGRARVCRERCVTDEINVEPGVWCRGLDCV
jgi:hypothetical protein